MEFDQGFKLLLSPDKIAETNAIIEAAIIQSNATIIAANIQFNATLLGSSMVVFSAIIALFSAIWQVSTEKRSHKNKVNAYRIFIYYKCEEIYKNISQARLVIGGIDISDSEKPLESMDFAFSFLNLDIEDMSPKLWDTHALLGGEIMGLINNLFASMIDLRETKEFALKKLSIINHETDNTNKQQSINNCDRFIKEFENFRGVILDKIMIVKENNDQIIRFFNMPIRRSLIDALW